MPESNSQIRVSVIKAPVSASLEAPAATPLSIYMYLAGLVVSLSGMYAVTYDMTDSNFALILRALIICGYAVSYWLRRNKIDLKQYQAPLLVVFATVMYFVASTSPNLSSAPQASGIVRPYQIQIVVIWIAVLQSFTLCSDSAILFACVPSMALIGIMSSGTPDDEVQNAFLVFLASATFLMVHENHLRTKATMALRNRAATRPDNRLFSGELVLVGCCVVGTMLLASVAATPIQIIGKALIPVNPQDMSKASQNKQNSTGDNVRVDEGSKLDVGTGPRSQSDVRLLEVTSTATVPYLRGTTYDYYSGRGFEDHLAGAYPIDPIAESPDAISPGIVPPAASDIGRMKTYRFDAAQWDLGSGRMDGAKEVTQTVKVLDGTITHLYAAPAFEIVNTAYPSLRRSEAGALSCETPLVQTALYRVISRVPNSDPDILRRASLIYPSSITSRYLQVTYGGGERNVKIQQFVDECIRGKATVYDRVVALRDAVSRQCTYNLQSPAIPRTQDVVASFLFDLKQGYCDSFATALTVACRYANIPARLASGFIAGDRQSDFVYIIREKHKHVWTEVYFANIGWIPFDATEGTADSTPSNGSNEKSELAPLRWLTSHGPGPLLLAAAVVILLGYVFNTEVLVRLRKRKSVVASYEALPSSNMEIIRSYQSGCATLGKIGLARAPSTTPAEYRHDVTGRLSSESQVVAALDVLTGLHERFSYGSAEAQDNDVDAATTALTRLTAATKTVPHSVRSEQHRSMRPVLWN